MIVSHVLVPPAMEAILSSERCRVQGFLAAGHVCAVMGQSEYEPIAERYRVPIVVTGFEPVDILLGVAECVERLEAARPGVSNPYARAVRERGNEPAQRLIREVFEVSPRRWRGIGDIPRSGLALREDYAGLDALRRFGVAPTGAAMEETECIAGLVLQGIRRPAECPAFGVRCTPDDPLGAPMVSDEGACAAYYRHARLTVGRS